MKFKRKVAPITTSTNSSTVKILADTKVFSLKEAMDLQKNGFKIVSIESEIKGIRPKAWILKKED